MHIIVFSELPLFVGQSAGDEHVANPCRIRGAPLCMQSVAARCQLPIAASEPGATALTLTLRLPYKVTSGKPLESYSVQ